MGNGTIDCMRDGFDETLQARFLMEENVRNGLLSFFQNISSHDLDLCNTMTLLEQFQKC